MREESNAEKNAIKINKAMYDEVANLLQPLPGAVPLALVANPQPVIQQIHSGQLAEDATRMNAEDIDGWHLSLLLGKHSSQQFAVQYTYLQPRVSNENQPKGKKRAHEDAATSSSAQKPSNPVKRRIRKCPNCKKTNCKGRFNSRPCERDDDTGES